MRAGLSGLARISVFIRKSSIRSFPRKLTISVTSSLFAASKPVWYALCILPKKRSLRIKVGHTFRCFHILVTNDSRISVLDKVSEDVTSR